MGIIRNHYVGRTFIQPTQSIREIGVRMKHSANRAVVSGKRIVLIDDSLVRGTTSLKIVQMMRDAGAREVHMRIASPPITHSDYYGIDTPERDKLLAANHDIEGMRAFIGRGHLPRHGPRAARSAAPAIHRPLLHRRLSHRAHRPQRRGRHPAAAFAPGRGELMPTPPCPGLEPGPFQTPSTERSRLHSAPKTRVNALEAGTRLAPV
jgi:hypothetical protein